MSKQEKEWLEKLLTALKNDEDLSKFQSSSFVRTILLGLRKDVGL